MFSVVLAKQNILLKLFKSNMTGFIAKKDKIAIEEHIRIKLIESRNKSRKCFRDMNKIINLKRKLKILMLHSKKTFNGSIHW